MLRTKRNKNETLARCRRLWVNIARMPYPDKGNMYGKLYGHEGKNLREINLNLCPLCEYVTKGGFYDIKTESCNRLCIDWTVDNNKNQPKACEDGSNASFFRFQNSYGVVDRISGARRVVESIDRAIKLYDETGEWK